MTIKRNETEGIDHKARTDIGEHIAECNKNREMIKSWFSEIKKNYEKLDKKMDSNYINLDKKMDVNQTASNNRFNKINNKLWASILALVGLLISIIFFMLDNG